MSGHKKIFAIFLSVLGVLAALTSVYAVRKPAETLKIGAILPEGALSPFFSDTEDSRRILDLCFEPLACLDRAGNILSPSENGFESCYQGVNYLYEGIAELKIEKDEEANKTKYIWTLSDGVCFQDGHEADADDIIFTYYVFLDPAYAGPCTACAVPIEGLDEYRAGNAENISGIRKIDEKSVEITVKSLGSRYASMLSVPLCPLHYYGNAAKYDYAENRFGFPKGDLSSVKKRSLPLGTGPYRPVSRDEKQLLLRANEYFHGGEPLTSRIVFTPCMPSECIEAIADGRIDMAFPTLGAELERQIRAVNTNANLYGDKLRTLSYESGDYGYIGINADRVNVDGRRGSAESKALRRAFATVFSYFALRDIPAYFGDNAAIENAAFLACPDGTPLFPPDASLKEKRESVKRAALAFLEKAGYTVSDGIVTQASEGARLSYTALFCGEGTGSHPCAKLLASASALLEEIGVGLEIRDLHTDAELWQAISEGEAEIFCAAWENPEAFALYHSSSSIASRFFGLSDIALDRILEGTADGGAVKRIVNSWSVEIPVYRRAETLVYSAERVENLVHNPTKFHSWLSEASRLKKR